jgi:putative two-component system response regulator
MTTKATLKLDPFKPSQYIYAPHDIRVGRYSEIVARYLGFSRSDAKIIGHAAALHDVGKLGISSSIWQKPAPLTVEEWGAVKRHPEIGANWLNGCSSPVTKLARSIALTHHERWDGTGYPLGLSGHKIPIVGRITMLVDQYDALRSARSYKAALTHLQACKIILEGDDRTRPSHFDPHLLDLFRRFHQDFNALFERFHEGPLALSDATQYFIVLSDDGHSDVRPEWVSRGQYSGIALDRL